MNFPRYNRLLGVFVRCNMYSSYFGLKHIGAAVLLEASNMNFLLRIVSVDSFILLYAKSFSIVGLNYHKT